MKNKKLVFFSTVLLAATTFIMVSCKKELSAGAGINSVPPGQNALKIMLTDDPSQVFDSIFIDIRKVEVRVIDSTGAEHWDSLTIRTGVYNILNFRNGLDTLLASGFVPNGRVDKIRVTLGTNNYVMLNGVTTPLVIPAGQNIITVSIDDDVDHDDSNHLRTWLDFDGQGSIQLHNGKLELKLHLGHFSNHNSGELEGKIKPSAAFPVVVKAVSGTDTLTAIPEREGEFKIRGIRTSTATLIITPSNGYKDSVINNIQIRQGNDTDLGNIVLHR
jgi:hypothetical protein